MFRNCDKVTYSINRYFRIKKSILNSTNKYHVVLVQAFGRYFLNSVKKLKQFSVKLVDE